MQSLRSVDKYLIRYKWLLLSGIFFVFSSNYFGLLPPEYIREGIDSVKDSLLFYDIIKSSNYSDEYKHYLFGKTMWVIALLIIISTIIRGILMFLMRQTLIVMSRKIEYDQKNEIYQKYQELSSSFYKQNNTGDLMSRISEDVSRVRMYFGPAIMYSINLMALFAMVIYTMLSINAYLSIYVLFPLPILAYLIYKVSNRINKKSEAISKSLSKLTTLAQENFSGIRVIHAYAIDKQIQQEFEQAGEDYKQQNISLAKIESFFSPLMLMLVGLSTLMVIYIGGLEVERGIFTAGNIAEFIYYVNMLTWPVASLGWAVSLVQRAAASQKRINEFLNNTNIIQGRNTLPIPTLQSIEFKGVNFTYPETKIQALKNITLSIQKGDKIAIVGKTGSGKSTLTDLLFRLYDADTGTILINGMPIQEIALQHYREKITYTPQDAFLFSDTVRNNILFGNPIATEQEVLHYAQVAAVHNDIMQLPKQYDTIVGERGIMLSGGQKQRISIARCLIKNPELLVLDDCLSAVDANTEKQILNHLHATFSNKTVIFITHRIFAIMNFDKIIVLDDGVIVEQGTHDMLIQQQGIYYELYQKQQKENLE